MQKKHPYLKKISNLHSFLFQRMLPVGGSEVSSLLYWRARILFAIILSSALFGIFILASVIPLAVKYKLWGLLLFDVSAWILCLLLLILPRISYMIRATISVLAMYGIGVIIIFSIGPISGGPAWLFCFSIFAAILLGPRAAVLAVSSNAIAIAIIGYLIHNNLWIPLSNLFTAQQILATGMNFLFLNILITLSISVLIKGLTQSHEKEKKLSASLEKSENRYRLIADNVADTIWKMDMNLGFTYISPSIYQQRGYTVEEGMAQTLNEIVPPDSLPKVMELLGEKLNLIETDNPDGWEPNIFEIEQFCKDGTTIWTSNNVRILQGSHKNPNGLLGVTRDITRQKLAENAKAEAEHHLAEQKKHALVGQIAGKMAHDFNNILGAIMGNTELSLLDCKEPETKNILKLIFEQTIRGKNLTKNLIAFAKHQEPKQKFFKISKKTELVINLLKKDLKGIELITENDLNIPELLADPGMIEHALVNFLQNSIHALSMTENPKIVIRTYSINDNICFEIEDNGCGIPKEYLENIYDLAFTLKGSQDTAGSYKAGIKGTGYGMYNIKKYIEQHNGNISVESKFGSGTKFTIQLPVIKKKPIDTKTIQIKQEKKYFGKYILLVEDEQEISDVQLRLLKSEPCNHKVDIAKDGKAAINLFNKCEYDLISMDYVLPGSINGMDIYHHIRKTNKTIPILFISGNLEFIESIKELKQKDINIDHLSKPCQNKDYLNSINELLTITLR
ncbi:MAG: PAS domain S-box protein [Desulfobacteraceae bacterium]|nr:PAS domain S-box protein [Desulfobacteraceae bacterium]